MGCKSEVVRFDHGSLLQDQTKIREKQRCTTGIRKCNKSAYLSHVLTTVKQFVGKSRIYRKKHLYMLISKTSFLTYCKT